MNPIKVAMIHGGYDSSPNAWQLNKTHYYFFYHALYRNKNLEIDHFNTMSRIDALNLEKNYDVVLIPYVTVAASLALPGIRDCNIPVIGRMGDPQMALRRDMFGLAKLLKIDWFFGDYAPASFYEYYPKHLKYETVYIGLEPSLYAEDIPWKIRTSDKIVISGALGKSNFVRKLYQRVYRRYPKALTPDFHYKLRIKCIRLPYVVHTRDLFRGQGTDQLPGILSGFRAAIAATTTFPTVKYKETPAAGCLTFMEITERNHGGHLGFVDGKNAIFIDEKNYKEKFRKYLDNPDDPRWRKIAHEGRQHALENLSNDKGTEMLVHIMRKSLGEENAEI